MADLATGADVTVRWRTVDPEENEVLARIDTLITAASALVRQHVSSVDTRIAEGSLSWDLVRHVVAEMVCRVLRNPSGAGSKSVGPFSESHVGPFGLVLSDSDLAMLSEPAATTTTGLPVGVGTVGLGAGLGYGCSPEPRWGRRGW